MLAAALALCWAPALAQDAGGGSDAAAAADGTEPAPDRTKVTLGKHSFRSFCSGCHGLSGKGDGTIAEMLTVRPADLTKLTENNGGEFPYDATLAKIDGSNDVKGHASDMPAWGEAFSQISASEEEVQQKLEQLVHFIWSIQEQ